MTTDKFFKVSCRTIDGTMWFTNWQGCLCETKGQGYTFSEKCADALIEREKERNRYRQPDDKHGWLTKHQVPGHNRHHVVKYLSPNWRAEKRAERKMGMADAIYGAYSEGQYNAMRKTQRDNPYPPGKRHDAWQHGFDNADPMGDYHGRNF